MSELNDFTEDTLTLNDFSSKTSLGIKASNTPSNINLATHSAILSSEPESLVNDYQSVLASLEDNPSKDQVDRIFEMAKKRQMVESRDALIDVLSDTSIDDQAKRAAAIGSIDVQNELYNSSNSLSFEALSKPDIDDNDEIERVKFSLSDAVHELNSVKAEQQALLNAAVASTDSSTANAYADIVEYFLPLVEQKFTADTISGFRDGDSVSVAKVFTTLGQTKMGVRDMVKSIPPEERLEVTQAIINAVNESKNITLVNENDYAKVDFLRTALEEGYYTDVDKWIDNVVSVLDLVGIGKYVGKAAKGLAKSTKIGSSISDIRDSVRRSVTNRVSPSSVSQNVKDTNSDMARSSHEAVAKDITDETSEALYSSTREDALSSDINPEIFLDSGSVTSKVNSPDLVERLRNSASEEVMDFVDNHGVSNALTMSEKIKIRSRVVNDVEHALGVTERSEMTTIGKVTGNTFEIGMVYGPAKSGFTSTSEALDSAKFAMRDFNLSDTDFELLVRRGGEFVPLKGATGRLQPEYLVRVNHKYNFNPSDLIGKADEFEVKRNLFDRVMPFGGSAGSINRHVFDPASTLDPTIVLSANSGIDKSARLEQLLLQGGGEFADNFTKLPKERQALLDSIIREANAQSKDLKYDPSLTPEEWSTLKSWREYWDTAYLLENRDLAITKRAQGFKEFVDVVNDTRLFVKPVARTQVAAGSRYYDHVNDSVVTISKQELNELYKSGGEMARMGQPLTIGDEAVDLILSSNSPGNNYLKAIDNNTQVLNYRKGYYTVNYKDPYFVVKVVRDHEGNELYQKAVDTAGSVKDAKMKTQRFHKTDGSEYIFRQDEKKLSNQGDLHWDLQQARGRISQRIRGDRLEDSTSSITDSSQAPILGPVDSMVLSARSLSNRVPMRSVIETHKRRAVEQYGEFLPENNYGQKTWPSNPDEVKYRKIGDEDRGRLADAKTTYEYINYLENGYINSLDEGYKDLLRSISNMAGEVNWGAIEKASMWASNKRGPTAMAKNAAFNMYLASNPLRQAIIQSHQAVQLTANFPGWVLSGKLVPEILLLVSQKMGHRPPKTLTKSLGISEPDAIKMFKDWENSGLSAAIDKQNLIRGSLADLADEVSSQGKAWNKVGAPLRGLRKIGFDAGEYANLMTAWLAHRHKAIKDGLDISDVSVLDDISGKARNYTYNMNSAGDMPYNQNFMASVFQFFQVPHKALLTMTSNRVLTPKQKLRLFGFNAVMYTLPPAVMLDLFGPVLPDDPAQRDLALNGLEGWTFNQLASKMSGEDTYIDWSGLAPSDLWGSFDLLHSLLTTDLGTIVANSPSGQLFAGGNPRITNLLKSTARWTNLIDDFEDPTTFGMVAHDFAMLSSGYSNAFKSAYSSKYGIKRNSMGGITDPNVNSAESIAQVFGFRTMDEAYTYYINTETYLASSEFRTDVQDWYKSLKRHSSRKGITPQEVEYIQKMHGEAWRVWGNDNRKAKDIIDSLIKKDIRDGEFVMYNRILSMQDIMSTSEIETLIKSMPYEDEDRKNQMLETIKATDEWRNK